MSRLVPVVLTGLPVVGCGAASNHARPWQVNLESEVVSNDVLVGPCL